MVEIDWSKLGFAYTPTRSHIRYHWKDGKWDAGALVQKDTIEMSIAAGCLHYGQEAFEGLKVFRQKDGKVVAFRPDRNAERMQRTAVRTVMPPVPTEMFLDALDRVVRDNIDYVPPYGTGCSMYVRPLLIGSGPQIGVAPAHEYDFLMMVMPMGDYYKGGIKPVRAIIFDEYDRAAPNGTGDIKIGGNYAASLYAHEKGTFAEIGACGTAVVVTPVYEIVRGDTTIRVGSPDVCGPRLQELHDMLQDIQFGRAPDAHGWCHEIK